MVCTSIATLPAEIVVVVVVVQAAVAVVVVTTVPMVIIMAKAIRILVIVRYVDTTPRVWFL